MSYNREKINIFENVNFNTVYPQMIEIVKEAIEKFWELEISLVLQTINNFKEIRREVFVKNTEFFSNQIKVEKHVPTFIRLSKAFVNNFLYAALQNDVKQADKFKLTDLTNLEIKILNNFCDFLYRKIKDILIPVNELKITEQSDNYINLLFLVRPKGAKSSYIMISIPQERIKEEALEKIPNFSDEDFLTSSTYVKIRAGNTKITLDELKNLSKEDIVVLEDSKSTRLTLISGELEKAFTVKPDISLILDIDNDENDERIYNEVIMEKNLWDDIQIELSAEFEKVKMTIGELKQITNGQVVDLGSVFNSEISLYVENKKVAKGDLIIVNDHYAVKLNEVLSSNVDKKPLPKAPATPPPPKETKKATVAPPPPKETQEEPKVQKVVTESQDEEFDYSDFEK